MNQTMKPHAPRQTNSDSFFGMALAQAFTATVLGPAADIAWETAEITSAVYEDRLKKPANDTNYALGAGGALTASFTGRAQGEKAQAPFFAPVIGRRAYPAYGM